MFIDYLILFFNFSFFFTYYIKGYQIVSCDIKRLSIKKKQVLINENS